MDSTGPPRVLGRALATSLTSGSFIDTKFWVYSHRDSHGQTTRLRPLYANSSVMMEQSTYFVSMLGGDFHEAIYEDMSLNSAPAATSYVDRDDSDLEDEAASIPESPTSDSTPKTRPGRVVVLRDAAFLTFHAILIWLHTGEIHFRDFGSSDAPQTASEQYPRPSAKSVYRLADKYEINVLKALVLDSIRKQVSSCDIVEELFSEFTSLFPEVRGIEVVELVRALRAPSTATSTREKLMAKLDDFGQGNIAHCSGSIVSLVDALLQAPTVSQPATVRETPPLPKSSALSSSLRQAITDAIKTGTFVDTKLNVQSNAHDTISLFYSKTALGKYHQNLEAITSDQAAAEHECDSDCEEDFQQNTNGSDQLEPVPDAFKVKIWRHEVQKAFLNKEPPKAEEMLACDELFTTIESYEKMTAIHLKSSKIRKVMRHVHSLPEEKVPRDSEFKFRDRAGRLNQKWLEILQAGPSTSVESEVEEKDDKVANVDDDGQSSVGFEGANASTTTEVKVGAPKTWKAVLYYIYTDHIHFGPLKSRGIKEDVQNSEVPMCSPKSVATLAHLLGLDPLQASAESDLKSKLTSQNIVDELFSRYSSQRPSVLEFQTQFLSDNRTSKDAIDLLKNKIRTTAGSSAHHSEALRSIIGSFIDTKKDEPEVELFQVVNAGAGRAFLRCANCHYLGAKSDYHNHASLCPNCGWASVCCNNCEYHDEFEGFFEQEEFCPDCDSMIVE